MTEIQKKAAKLIKELRSLIVEEMIMERKDGAHIIMMNDDYIVTILVKERIINDQMEN